MSAELELPVKGARPRPAQGQSPADESEAALYAQRFLANRPSPPY